MSNKRINLTQFEDLTTPWDFGKKYPHIESAKVAVELIAELKKLYEFMDLHQICGCGAICPNMNKETWARVKICGFCESAE